MKPSQVLLQYWGYSSFRPLQEDIIQSVLDGNDTLALLPTGGGKSLCFQVPAMVRDGVCVVISPLIALMKDQVANLRRRGIPAAAIYTGMHRDEIDRILGNCRFGNLKFLYISPERLKSDKITEVIRLMKVNLLAVDEAHCISQWGHDFRPPYMDIADIRPLIPGTPVLALTATATPEVVSEIQKNLGFRKENVFQKSFERKNLTYLVIKEEDKLNRLLRILNRVPGSGIIYVRNRRQTREIAEFLRKNGISAGFYHAGLDPAVRDQRQNAWTKEDIRIIVSTNAFGMGIDKPNVRLVVHLDLPDCIEAYFQEAGRGGRDEKRAYAVLLYEEADILDSRQNLSMAFPELKTIRDVYQAVGNYYQVPVGMGMDNRFDFDLPKFAEQYGFLPVTVFNSLRFLEKEGYLILNEALKNPARIFIKADKETLYRFQVANATLDPLIKTMLRLYGGILSDFTTISETEIARRSGLSPEKVISGLQYLEKNSLLDYIPATDKPHIIFARERVDPKHLSISPENYLNRREKAEERLERMIAYTTGSNRCRSQELLAYFGEKGGRRCGLCDVCIERNKVGLNEMEFDTVVEKIKPLLSERPSSLKEIVDSVGMINEDKVLRAVQWLMDNEKILLNSERKYFWNKK